MTTNTARVYDSAISPSVKLFDSFQDNDRFRSHIIPLRKHDDAEKRYGRTRLLGKAPLHSNWPKREYTSDEVRALAVAGHNLGYRIPKGVVVIDIDPRNGGIDGFKSLCKALGYDFAGHRKHVTGSDGLHIFCTVPEDFRCLDTVDGFPGVEFKSAGRQVVLPGSIHPETKKMYKVEAGGGFKPAPAKLLQLVERPAVTNQAGGGEFEPHEVVPALNALDPTDFRNHGEWLQVMMAVHHATGGEARDEFIDWSTNDPRYVDAAYEIGARWDSLHKDRDSAVTYRTLNHILREKGLGQFQLAHDVDDDAFSDGEPTDFDNPEVGDSDFEEKDREKPTPFTFDMNELPKMLDYAEAAMLADSVPIYQQGGRLVHPVRSDRHYDVDELIRRAAGSLILRDVTALRLREYMITSAPFYKIVQSRQTKRPIRVPFAAPTELASHYLARDDKWRVPTIEGVIETPTLRRDGTLLTDNGYDDASGLLLDTGGVEFPKIKDNPTRDDAIKALGALKWPFKDFPFVKTQRRKS